MMTWVLIAAFIVVCALNSVFLDQAHRRLARSSERFLDALIRAGDRNQETHASHREEIQALLQRIQAPEAAVVEHQQKALGDEPAPPPMTDEEIAERDALIAEIEQFENDGLGIR